MYNKHTRIPAKEYDMTCNGILPILSIAIIAIVVPIISAELLIKIAPKSKLFVLVLLCDDVNDDPVVKVVGVKIVVLFSKDVLLLLLLLLLKISVVIIMVP